MINGYCSTTEAAQKLGVSIDTVKRMCNDGRITGWQADTLYQWQRWKSTLYQWSRQQRWKRQLWHDGATAGRPAETTTVKVAYFNKHYITEIEL